MPTAKAKHPTAADQNRPATLRRAALSFIIPVRYRQRLRLERRAQRGDSRESGVGPHELG